MPGACAGYGIEDSNTKPTANFFSISANAESRVPKALSARARPVLSTKPAIALVHPADMQNIRLVTMISSLDFVLSCLPEPAPA
jgi:hypothetical protein